ncbi:MAG: hypothetical protein SXA11_05635 [Cyanobacteriota bacterium]|nr:hypothetical protein [Cyanobacteriota bacterium]
MSEKQQPSFWDSVSKKATEVGENIGKKASETGKTTIEKAAEAAKKKTSEVRETIASKTIDVSKTVTDSVKDSWETTVRPEGKEGAEIDDWDRSDSEKTADENDWNTSNSQEIEVEEEEEEEEIYHVFISYQTAVEGGTQKVTLRSGKSYDVNIRRNTTEGASLRLRKSGLRGNDAYLVLHTLYDPETNIDRRINKIVVRTPIYDRSKTRCLEAYNKVNAGLYAEDLAALDLLDFAISLSNIESAVGLRYKIASENSRWLGTDKYVEEKIETANLTNSERQWLKITYKYIKLGEPVPNLVAWEQLNSIVLNGDIPRLLKQKYLLASANSIALRVDMKIVDGIGGSPEIREGDRRKYISVYHQLRQGKKRPELAKLERLDAALFNSDIPGLCLMVYKLAQERLLEVNEDVPATEHFQAASTAFKKTKELVNTANNKNAKHIFTDTAVNMNMLANAAYNSVAGGGLGVLEGVTALKGGEALVAAAGLVAIAAAEETTVQEKVRLGIQKSKGFSPPIVYEYFRQNINGNGWLTGNKNRKGFAELLGVDGLFRNKQEVEQTFKDLEIELYSN